MPTRIAYLDIARGIGILLVVLGHNDLGALSPFLHRLIYSFHIPLFFFLSGYFLNTSLLFLDFLKKRFHGVLKPYLFTISLIYFASVSFEKMGFETALVRILKSLYGSINYIDWGQLWFLPHLFVVSLYAFVFIAIANRLRNRWVKWGMLLGTLVISFLFLHTFYPFSITLFGNDYEVYGLPFSVDVVLLSGFFFLLGKEVRQLTSETSFDNPLLLIGTGLALVVLNYIFPYRVDLAVRVYESLLVNTAEAILGILFVLALSRQIELRTNRLATVLEYLGNIALIILIFHLPIQAFWGDKSMALTENLPLSISIGFIMGVAGSILIHELFIRYNPVASFWFGRNADLPAQKTLPLPEAQAVAKPPSPPVVDIKE
jgi:polysaccharide biosynthesis protein PslL